MKIKFELIWDEDYQENENGSVECLQCLQHDDSEYLSSGSGSDIRQECQAQVPENISKVFDKLCQRDEVGSNKDQSVIDWVLEIKLLYLIAMPLVAVVKIIRLTAFLLSFLVFDNWIKHLVETLTSFLLGNILVTQSKVHLARLQNLIEILFNL